MGTVNYRSVLLTEKQKEDPEYLMDCIDAAISELVYEKDSLRKAYNYYEGKRDKDQYKHLEDNFGIGTPTSVEFIPLIKSHIDVLIGEHLQNKLKPKITCKDRKTINLIEKQRKEAIYAGELERLKSQMMNNLWYALQTEEEKKAKQPPVDKANEREISKLKDDLSRNFKSDFEVAAQDIVTHLIQSREVDLYTKLKILFLDILVAGQCYYKVSLQHEGETPEIEILNPFDTFIENSNNYSSPYVKKRARSVVRYWYTKTEIISKYGHKMEKEDIDALDSEVAYDHTAQVYYIRSASGGLISNVDITIPYSAEYDRDFSTQNLYPVYEVEWTTNTEIEMKDGINGKGYRTDIYEGVRIGADIYCDMGKKENVIRSIEKPNAAYLSVNGFCPGARGTTYSLVLAAASIQDKYDLLHFWRDTLMANSGVQGDFMDVSQLPAFLGTEPAERLMKWIGYKKNGVALLDSSQEGRAANLNTIFGGFDDTVKGDAIQAIGLAIQQTEAACSNITGVFRERLGGIEQRDAVTNVEVGVKQSAIITKSYFHLMDNITAELLVDAINQCKYSYRKGFVGSIILGDKQRKIFTVDPKNFSFTDHDVHIADSGDIIKDMQKIEGLSMELIKGGLVDPEVVFQAITTESMTEMQESILNGLAKKKEENDIVGNLQQQLEQAQQQQQQMQQEMQKIARELEAFKKRNLDLEEAKVKNDFAIRSEANDNVRVFNDGKLKLDEEKVELEKLQMFDNNPNNNEVKMD